KEEAGRSVEDAARTAWRRTAGRREKRLANRRRTASRKSEGPAQRGDGQTPGLSLPAVAGGISRRDAMADLSQIKEHMEIIGADGVHIGTVDRVEGDRIRMTRADSGSHG